jgi:signal transduction histidine kinase
VKYMNGKLWVDSGYTRGARFCFTHPLKYNPALHGGTAQ